MTRDEKIFDEVMTKIERLTDHEWEKMKRQYKEDKKNYDIPKDMSLMYPIFEPTLVATETHVTEIPVDSNKKKIKDTFALDTSLNEEVVA